ncbi:uncharacterized protein BBOV_IV004170 [Babesia bovis T2Bo]|uniref:Membrane protein, putative n=1 Tax=Babesia bovis TaxID=5865 RepID=A7AQF9_BABBO|nr:uncharacterized protein BBOV_IV004170 [Babesia bovis T2Bo]EDO06778.1 TB2/DP1 HVA22 family protein [Babesia bovis T2Bo]BAN64186.1 membrane protein, putative [Babesia bovis]|eukprot:XP_001610346.1 hypothetical protein [Babesia bovis T2Bo]
MVFSLLPRPVLSILNLAICVLYPGYHTFAHLYHGILNSENKKNADDPRLNSGLISHYIFYWTIYFLYVKLEASALVYVSPYIPSFYEMKLLAFYWLASDHFKGAGYLFHRYVMKNLLHTSNIVRNEIDNKLDARHRKTLNDIVSKLGSIEDVNFVSME